MHDYRKILDAKRSNETYLLQDVGKTEAIGEIGTLAPREHIKISMPSHASGILYPSLAF